MARRLVYAPILALFHTTAFAQSEPPEPAPPAQDPPPPDRYDELARRVEQLEAELRAARDVPPPAPAPDPVAPVLLAGYARKQIFLRDRDDIFVLLPKGRLNVDYYEFLRHPGVAPGVVENGPQDPTQALRDNLFIRRARVGLAGTIARHVDFRLEGEFANLPSVGQYASFTDASIQLNWSRYALLEVGQFYAPFTLENPTSENYTDFMEKSATVRFVVPTSRETGAMVLGDLPSDIGRYWVGVFDGDGQNFKNQDNLGAVIGRVHVTPLAAIGEREEWKDHLWLGGSFWVQNTDNLGGFVAPSTTAATQNDLSPVTTQGGINLFNSSYGNGSDANKNPIRSHLAPDGWIVKHALELSVPLPRRFGFRGEVVHQQISLREYDDVSPGTGTVTRTRGNAGALDGWGGYAEVYAWLGGDADTDFPGLYRSPHWSGYEPPLPAAWSVMLAAKYEHVQFDVTGLSVGTSASGAAIPDPAVGQWALDVVDLGATVWLTRHTRAQVNYVVNYFGGNLSNPALLETKNIFYHYSDHELLARFAVQL